jgi:hypothetical protein
VTLALYHPALTHEALMSIQDHPTKPPAPRGVSGRAVVLVSTTLALVALLAVALFSRDTRSATSAERVPSISATVAPTTTIDPRVEVVERLREILRLRDKALTRRDASLLDGIYTVDCNCLENTRRLIRGMREDRVVWRGLSTSLSVQNVEKASDRLWHITGVLTTSMVRIEEESGGLIRVAPAEHDRFRFAVVRPRSSQDWLLGYAAILG